MVWTKMLIKTSLVTALTGGFMFFGNATNVRAGDKEAATRTSRIWNGSLSAMPTAMGRTAARRNTIDTKWKKLATTASGATAIMTETATAIEITTTTTTGTDKVGRSFAG